MILIAIAACVLALYFADPLNLWPVITASADSPTSRESFSKYRVANADESTGTFERVARPMFNTTKGQLVIVFEGFQKDLTREQARKCIDVVGAVTDFSSAYGYLRIGKSNNETEPQLVYVEQMRRKGPAK